ncbi:MAG: HTH-type transcriptional repressor RghR [Syntrophorhabdus sp. PtaU1.Bin002]|nr:MAG: HTH-type transcriptional repressor RghR [Syntrophorhabdus sp. PtaB.Bin006]OPY69713.1 MAG: HTH-type transcriptional repressor RghR [Syntrophorhabdus sp. PtaU1.Bin002]
MTIATKLKRLRKLRKLSMTELSKNSGVHQTTISAIESGKHNSPGIDTIERLAGALRVSPLYFFESRVQTPFDLIDNLPSDLSDFLLRAESLPYLLLSKKAYEEGVSSRTIEKLLSVLQDNYSEKFLTEESEELKDPKKKVAKPRGNKA